MDVITGDHPAGDACVAPYHGKRKEGTGRKSARALWVVKIRSTSVYYGSIMLVLAGMPPVIQVVSEVGEIGLVDGPEVRHPAHAPAAGEVGLGKDMPGEIAVMV